MTGTTKGDLEERLAMAKRLDQGISWKAPGVFLYPPEQAWRTIAPRRVRGAFEALAAAGPSEGASDPVGLYVHLPDALDGLRGQASAALADLYLACLAREADRLGPPARLRFQTLYIGSGGTGALSALTERQMERLLAWLRRRFRLDALSQAVAEIDPLALTADKARLLARHGIDRVTMTYPRSDDPRTAPAGLRDFSRACDACRRHGIRFLDIDVMAGWPGQEQATFRRDLRSVMSLWPDMVHLRVWKGPDPGSWAGAIRLAEKRIAASLSRRRGLDRGENLQLSHSSGSNCSVLGLGFGAVGHVRDRLTYGKGGTWLGYLKALVAGGLPPLRGMPMSRDREMRAHVIRGLEDTGRIEAAAFRVAFGKRPREVFPREFAWLSAKGWLRREGPTMRLAGEGARGRAAAAKLFYEPGLLGRLAAPGRDFRPPSGSDGDAYHQGMSPRSYIAPRPSARLRVAKRP